MNDYVKKRRFIVSDISMERVPMVETECKKGKKSYLQWHSDPMQIVDSLERSEAHILWSRTRQRMTLYKSWYQNWYDSSICYYRYGQWNVSFCFVAQKTLFHAPMLVREWTLSGIHRSSPHERTLFHAPMLVRLRTHSGTVRSSLSHSPFGSWEYSQVLSPVTELLSSEAIEEAEEKNLVIGERMFVCVMMAALGMSASSVFELVTCWYCEQRRGSYRAALWTKNITFCWQSRISIIIRLLHAENELLRVLYSVQCTCNL